MKTLSLEKMERIEGGDQAADCVWAVAGVIGIGLSIAAAPVSGGLSLAYLGWSAGLTLGSLGTGYSIGGCLDL